MPLIYTLISQIDVYISITCTYNPVNAEETSTSIPSLSRIFRQKAHCIKRFNLHHEEWEGSSPKSSD